MYYLLIKRQIIRLSNGITNIKTKKIMLLKINPKKMKNGSIFGKRALLAIGHIMLALFWSYVPNMK